MVEFCVVRWLDDHDDNGDFFITINDLPEGDLSYTMISLHQVLRRKIFESSYIYLPASQPLSVPTPFEIMKIQGFEKQSILVCELLISLNFLSKCSARGFDIDSKTSQPLSLSAAQPLSLPASQPLSLPASQPLSLPATFTPS